MKKCHQVGFGFDSHRYSRSGTLVLGGERFKGVPSLKGHSDGDALLHAVIDALLGGAGLGDIGDFFPDTSKKFKGISSQILLKEALKKVKSKKLKPTHVDVTIVAEKPRLSHTKAKMRKKIAKLLGLKPPAINLKAKTPEGLRLFQAPGGIAVWAVATLHSN